ncbi:hypothetical protein [Flaviaesturariibacter amylovorans]|uniref:YtxH domain-containing protein n=1 Tax=Flaviaesturariibacter amylovorans TaxID=1084520 RepID=A0ABP8H2Q3_9BACT
MKRILLFASLCVLAACGNDAGTPGQKLDTLLNKADRLGDSLKVQAKESWDSTKAGARGLGEKVEGSFDPKNDTLVRDTPRN